MAGCVYLQWQEIVSFIFSGQQDHFVLLAICLGFLSGTVLDEIAEEDFGRSCKGLMSFPPETQGSLRGSWIYFCMGFRSLPSTNIWHLPTRFQR